MKNRYRILLALTIILGLNSCALFKKNKSSNKVTLNILKIEQYCGGAAPPEELMEELMKPTPFVDTLLYLYRMGEQGFTDMQMIRTNKKGNVVVGLETGQYGLFLYPLDKLDDIIVKLYGTDVDLNCCRDFFNIPVSDVVLDGVTSELQVPVVIQCNPCLPPAP